MLDTLKHVNICQVSPQLSWGDTCQIWTWYFTRNQCFISDIKMGMLASQITSLTIVYLTVYSDADQRKYQSSASLAFVWGIHRGPVNSLHKWPVTRKMFPFDDVIMFIGLKNRGNNGLKKIGLLTPHLRSQSRKPFSNQSNWLNLELAFFHLLFYWLQVHYSVWDWVISFYRASPGSL